jgi:hypothetical protein
LPKLSSISFEASKTIRCHHVYSMSRLSFEQTISPRENRIDPPARKA